MEFHKFSQILIVCNYNGRRKGTETEVEAETERVWEKYHIAFAVLSGFSIKIKTKRTSGNVQAGFRLSQHWPYIWLDFPCHIFPQSNSVPLTLLCDFPQFNFRMKQRDISEFLFYFISLFHFHFHFFFSPTTCSIFLLSSSGAGIYIIWQTDGRGSRVLPQIDFIITFYFLGDKLPAHFWTHFLCKLQRTFWPLKCPCSPYVCVSVYVCAYLVLHSFVVGLCDKFFI